VIKAAESLLKVDAQIDRSSGIISVEIRFDPSDEDNPPPSRQRSKRAISFEE
jgi:hypothetical protein